LHASSLFISKLATKTHDENRQQKENAKKVRKVGESDERKEREKKTKESTEIHGEIRTFVLLLLSVAFSF